jgi:hypothetical protein
MEKIFYIVLILFWFVSCQDYCIKYKNEKYVYDSLTIDSNVIKRIHEVNNLLNEPDFEKINFESYRLIYKKALSNVGYLIRLDRKQKNTILTYKIFTGKNDTCSIIVNLKDESIIKLSNIEWKEFENLIYKNEFWTMQTIIDNHGVDGTIYYLEGCRPQAITCNKRTNHLVERWSPDPGGFKEICDKMIYLAEKNK